LGLWAVFAGKISFSETAYGFAVPTFAGTARTGRRWRDRRSEEEVSEEKKERSVRNTS